jgi:hypothetical protein
MRLELQIAGALYAGAAAFLVWRLRHAAEESSEPAT